MLKTSSNSFLFCLTAVLYALTASPGLAGENLGRIFFTPNERVALEGSRHLNENDAATGQTTEAEARSAPAPTTGYTLQGVVRRSENRHTVWLNGETLTTAELPPRMRLITPVAGAQIQVEAPKGKKPWRLKPGQTLDMDTGLVHDTYRQTR